MRSCKTKRDHAHSTLFRFATAWAPIAGQRSFLAVRVPFAFRQVILRAASCEPRAKHPALRGCRDHEVRCQLLCQAADLVVPPGRDLPRDQGKKTMLKRIPSILSPELLYLIAQMGHGDELVIADANFPAVTNAKRLVRADGHSVPAILEAILQLYPLDSYVEKPAAVMRRVDKPGEPAPIWNEYQRLLDSAEGRHIAIEQVERFAFYDRAKQTFGVVATGETALYGNLIIKKGVIAPS